MATDTAEIQVAHAARAKDAHERMKAAQQERDDAIRDAAAAGASLRTMAQAVGISHQRIAQIVKADADFRDRLSQRHQEEHELYERLSK